VLHTPLLGEILKDSPSQAEQIRRAYRLRGWPEIPFLTGLCGQRGAPNHHQALITSPNKTAFFWYWVIG